MSNIKDANVTMRRHWKHWDTLFNHEFSKESDRASVILSASMLDQVLETILRSCFCPTTSADDPLLDGANAPLSTFASRIDACYRIGMISAKLCRDLHIIRKVRNEFAHNVTGCTFDSAGVRNRILELTRSSDICQTLPEKRIQFPEGPKGDFQITVSMFLTHLWILAEGITQYSPKTTEFIYSVEFWKHIREKNDEEKVEPGA